MKAIALILATTLIGSTAAYADTTSSATLVSSDRGSRLVAVDGARIKQNTVDSYAVESGTRELQFQLMIPGATAPGKGLGYAYQQVRYDQGQLESRHPLHGARRQGRTGTKGGYPREAERHRSLSRQ